MKCKLNFIEITFSTYLILKQVTPVQFCSSYTDFNREFSGTKSKGGDHGMLVQVPLKWITVVWESGRYCKLSGLSHLPILSSQFYMENLQLQPHHKVLWAFVIKYDFCLMYVLAKQRTMMICRPYCESKEYIFIWFFKNTLVLFWKCRQHCNDFFF